MPPHKDKVALLTGASGFLGQHTEAALKNAGWDVIRTSRRPGVGYAESEIYCDLDRPETILALKNRLKPSAIIHLACHVGWDGSDQASLFRPNVLATGCLANLASGWNAKIIFSSATIVHGVKTEFIDGNTPLNADTEYANSKLLAEELIQSSGAKHAVLRISGIYGQNGPKHLGLNRAIDDALNGIVPTQVGDGSAKRNYIYVKDVAQVIMDVLRQELEGVQLVAGGETLTVAEMLNCICEVFVPGAMPILKEGPSAAHQIILSTVQSKERHSFREALLDIRGSSK